MIRKIKVIVKLFLKEIHWAREMAHYVNELAVRSDNPSSIPGTHTKAKINIWL